MPPSIRTYVRRIDGYMQKALHEAKVHTSWINPNAAYEEAVTKFVERVLEPTPRTRSCRSCANFKGPSHEPECGTRWRRCW
jgi:(1->4)-alpha-D-glucan 1-alpha-D-glucosylmutase